MCLLQYKNYFPENKSLTAVAITYMPSLKKNIMKVELEWDAFVSFSKLYLKCLP